MNALVPYQPPFQLALQPPGQLSGQAETDAEVIRLWLHGRSPNTQRAYRHDYRRFLAFCGAPLGLVTLGNLQAFADSLTGISEGSKARSLAAVKSLLAFAQKIGYIRYNVGSALPLPHVKDSLAERILDQASVLRMIYAEANPRNGAMLRLLYVGGLRVSELCGLRWRDLQPAGDKAGQVAVYGKGGKTRVIRLTPAMWDVLQKLRAAGTAPALDDPVFRSMLGGTLDPSQVRRIVTAAAKRVGLEAHVSPHWFRHAHASHALDSGAPIHLVQATLGHSSVATTGRYLHARPTESSARFLPA